MKRYVVGLLVLALVAWIAAPAPAALVTQGQDYKISDVAPGTQGPFKMTQQGGTIVFETYCVEQGETFSWSTTYTVANDPWISPNRVSAKTGRTLQDYGAWVYDIYVSSPSVYNWAAPPPNSTSLERRDAIQRAIWWSMVGLDVGAPIDGKYREWDLAVNTGTGGVETVSDLVNEINAWVASPDNIILKGANLDYQYFVDNIEGKVDLSNIVVLNLVVMGTDPAVSAQDQIAKRDTSQSSIPEPASMLVWSLLGGAGLGLAGVRRRRRA